MPSLAGHFRITNFAIVEKKGDDLKLEFYSNIIIKIVPNVCFLLCQVTQKSFHHHHSFVMSFHLDLNDAKVPLDTATDLTGCIFDKLKFLF